MVSAMATDIEIIVIRWLDARNIEYRFQTSLRGGWYALGGAVVDFLLDDSRLAWRIFGEYWHRGIIKEGSDLIQREMLARLGWQVVDLWGDDIKDRTDETLSLALEGQEVLK